MEECSTSRIIPQNTELLTLQLFSPAFNSLLTLKKKKETNYRFTSQLQDGTAALLNTHLYLPQRKFLYYLLIFFQEQFHNQ